MTSYSPIDLYFPDSDGQPMADNTEQFNLNLYRKH
ncbi:hypothetical protein LEP3755_56340 [Leptolyngbya sp. NIES-3755]|nr:hypothetical protein LEP3755_56340 [Leptolyngbya sp. NIES-3755]